MSLVKNLELKTVRLRLVEITDAEFILSLRLDSRYNTYLSKVSTNIEAQRNWLIQYKNEEKKGTQYYFIIEKLDKIPCGTVRVYDLTNDSFCWGSWILNENKPRLAALESALLVYKFGFDILGFKKSHFDVMKENQRVIDFHKKFGATQIAEDDLNFYFNIYPENIKIIAEKFSTK